MRELVLFSVDFFLHLKFKFYMKLKEFVGTPFLTPSIFPMVSLPSLRAKIRSTYRINGTIDGDVVSLFKFTLQNIPLLFISLFLSVGHFFVYRVPWFK